MKNNKFKIQNKNFSPSGWVETTLGEVCEINPTESLPKGKIAKCVPMDCINSFTRQISRFEEKEFNGGMKFRNGDTLLARITPCLENGKTAYVDFLDENEIGFGSTEYIVIREKQGLSDKKFLYYLAVSPSFKEIAIKAMTGTSGRQRVQIDVLVNKNFLLPPLPGQQAIASVLSAFDDKIELLREENKTLEETGQVIFKEWFGKYSVDKPEELPEGWRVGKLGEKNFAEIIGSGINEFDGEKIYLATANVSDSNITNTNEKITFKERPSRANMQPIEKSIWFAKMQDSRKLLMFDDYSEFEIENFILSTGFAGIKTTEISHYFMWCFILSKEFDELKNNMANGAVQIAVNNTNLEKIEILIPDNETLVKFNELAKPIFKKIYDNNSQIQSLACSRDEILPKLMAGMVRVNF
ncbi:restriction endonuclease subunit S [Patescibacteria group bacterium]|nr:restriction endonuclease subunit S [Patescibacteria group bacterium]